MFSVCLCTSFSSFFTIFLTISSLTPCTADLEGGFYQTRISFVILSPSVFSCFNLMLLNSEKEKEKLITIRWWFAKSVTIFFFFLLCFVHWFLCFIFVFTLLCGYSEVRIRHSLRGFLYGLWCLPRREDCRKLLYRTEGHITNAKRTEEDRMIRVQRAVSKTFITNKSMTVVAKQKCAWKQNKEMNMASRLRLVIKKQGAKLNR